MKKLLFVALAGLPVISLCFAYSPPQRRDPQIPQPPAATQRLTPEKEISIQQNINRYFHGTVVSKLKTCWNNIQGKGTIGLKYTFTKTGARWTFSRVETEQSTLPGAQNAVAMRCMETAVRGTSFPTDSTDITSASYVLYWTWPVPLPPNSTELVAAMLAAKPKDGGSTGGCDGHGAAAKCFTCSKDLKSCVKVCVGFKECSIVQSHNTLSCGGSGPCASGGPFGVTGGTIIY